MLGCITDIVRLLDYTNLLAPLFTFNGAYSDHKNYFSAPISLSLLVHFNKLNENLF